MKNSKIEWTDHTFNPWIGCTKVSTGCANCYAERDFDFRKHVSKWGPGNPRHKTSEAYWKQPLKWDRDYAELVRCANLAGEHPPRRPRVFCGSLCDLLDSEVPIEWLAELLSLIKETPMLNWLLLTKRPQLWRERLSAVITMRIEEGARGIDQCSGAALAAAWLNGAAPANVWLGTTVEDQQRADERIPELLNIPAKVRFLSCEPLLEKLDLLYPESIYPGGPQYCCSGHECGCMGQPIDPPLVYGIHWVICGGESGPHARPMHPDWARSLRDQCKAAGVPFFFKQWGAWREPIPGEEYDTSLGRAGNPPCFIVAANGTVHCFENEQTDSGAGVVMVRKSGSIRCLLDGNEHKEFPE